MTEYCIGLATGALIAAFMLVVGVITPKGRSPQAIDVYQGRTTLEYKVVDGEIVDSCVVWKGNYGKCN